MTVFLVRDFISDEAIIEAEGVPLTGHPESIQVNKIKVDKWGTCRRVFYKYEWYPTLEEAKSRVMFQIDRYEQKVKWEEESLERKKRKIERMKQSDFLVKKMD